MRSFIANGKVSRDQRTGRVRRASSSKKMTVELAPGGKGQGPFVWPEEMEDERGGGKEEREGNERMQEQQRKRQTPDERHKLDPPDAATLRKTAEAFLQGKARWKPSWEENGGQVAAAMGKGTSKRRSIKGRGRRRMRPR